MPGESDMASAISPVKYDVVIENRQNEHPRSTAGVATGISGQRTPVAPDAKVEDYSDEPRIVANEV